MTLKSRNRLNFSLLIFSAAVFVTEIMLVTVQFFRGTVSFKDFESFKTYTSPLLLRYSPYSVIASIFFEVIFALFSFYILLRAFTKTQAQNLLFFYLFLTAAVIDSVRLIVPFFNIASTYSSLLIACGNTTIFVNIIMPLSLLCYIITAEDEYKINIEQLMFAIILLSLFFASIIPLNTSKTLPDFNVDFSFKKIIIVLNIFSYVISLTIIIVRNALKKNRQITSIGFALMITGLTILRTATNYLSLVIGLLLTAVGQFMYLKALHNQYLWND